MNIYQLAERFKREQLRRERAAATEMTRIYGRLWREIDRQIRELMVGYYRVLEAGGEASGRLYQVQRLQMLRAQVEAQLREYARYADTTIQAQQWYAIRAGREHANDLMVAASDGTMQVFNTLPVDALNNLIGFTQEGPLLDKLNEYANGAGQALADGLIQGMALGYNPTQTARLIRAGFGMALWQALRLARTATLNAYRAASLETYRANSDIMEGWFWLSARNTRTCAMCWAMDGTFHKLEDSLDDHPNGRCTVVPKIKRVDLPQRMTGVEAFEKLSDVDKLKVLGPSKYAAYRAGDLGLKQLIGVKHSDVWGRMFYERSLKDVLGERAKEYYPSKIKKVLGFSFYRPEAYGNISFTKQVYQIGYGSRGWAYHEQLFRSKYLPRFKVKDDIEWTVGLWGTPEPSFNARLRGRYQDVIRLTQQWGKDFNQEGMALLIPSKGAKGGALSWDFGRKLSLDEMDRLLRGLMKVNEELKPEDVIKYIGLTVKNRSRVEFWVRNTAERFEGVSLIENALKYAGLNASRLPWQGGYEFILMGKKDY